MTMAAHAAGGSPRAANLDADLARRLVAIVGERRVLFRGSELLAYSSDGLPGYFKQPSIAVFPGTR